MKWQQRMWQTHRRIYVQERNENTDAQCEAAKAAWDALTDAQKEMVEGEEASPEYFGRDTGDALRTTPATRTTSATRRSWSSASAPRSTTAAQRHQGHRGRIQAAYPDWSVRRAFTAQIIINHVQARDGEKIDNMEQALERAVANGVKNLSSSPPI